MLSPKRKAGRHRIYMNVGYLLTEEQLRGYFLQFGPLLDVYLPKHKSGRNKGFGFTTFENDFDLDRVLRASEHVIDGVVVKINRAGPRPEYDQSNSDSSTSQRNGLTSNSQQPSLGEGPRIYVGGIPDEINEDELREHFSKWGAVVDIYFPGKKGQKRVNYCFVTFDHWRAAQRACNESDRNIKGKALQSISIAEERLAEQRADTQANHNAATALASFLNCAAPLGYNPMASHPLSLQALSQSLNGLNFYSPRPPDSPLHGLYANGVMPAHPNALLEGLQPSDGSFMGQPLLNGMHSMHAAAMQQAQLNAQLAAAGMGMPQTLDPAAVHGGHLDPNAFRAPGLDGVDQGNRATWAWSRGRSLAQSPRAPATPYAHAPSAPGGLAFASTPAVGPFENGHANGATGLANGAVNGAYHENGSPAWYSGCSSERSSVNGLANGCAARQEATFGPY